MEVDSSAIRRIDYDAEARELAIAFTNGRDYVYFDVPPEVFEDLAGAASVGRRFHEAIDGRYGYRKV